MPVNRQTPIKRHLFSLYTDNLYGYIIAYYLPLPHVMGIFLPVTDRLSKTPAELQRELGERLRRLRIDRDLSQAQLAGKAGISLKTLRNLELGAGSSVDTLLRTLKALGLPSLLDGLAPAPTVSPLALLKGPDPPRRVRRARKRP
jgi:DNA-binding XRE family transcriptional regulator